MTGTPPELDLWAYLEPTINKHLQRDLWRLRLAKGERQVTSYADVRNAAMQVARQLHERSVGEGDIVAVMAPNGPEWSAAALAVWYLGAIVAPVHVANSDEDIDTQLEALQPAVLCIAGVKNRFSNTLEIDVDAMKSAPDPQTLAPRNAVDWTTEAVRIYTSGSTGTPKMVMLSHRNIVSNLDASCRVIPLDENDVFLQLLPMSHAMGLTGGLLLAMVNGASLVVPRVVAAGEIIDAMGEESVSLMVAVPRLFRNIMQGLEKRFREASPLLRLYIGFIRMLPLSMRGAINGPLKRKFGRVKCWVSGGSRLDPEITRYFQQIGFPVRQGYGLTETSPTISVSAHHDPVLDGVGTPLHGVEVRIHEPDANGSGELWVRGPSVMMGYTDPSLTAEVIEDGWFKTGDIARLGENDTIILTGRAKRLIVTEAGKNVYPEEIEILLERFETVKEAGVIELDMKPVAVLACELEGDQAVDALRGVLKEFNQRTSGHNQITRFAVVDELPRTPLGKIALANLPDVFAENEVGRSG